MPGAVADMPKLRFQYPVYQQPGRVTFGTGSLRVLAELPDLEHTLFFVSGQSAVQAAVADCMARRDRAWHEQRVLTKPPGEPGWQMVRDGADAIRDAKPQRIVGIGGGSVLDWCRLAWAASIDVLDDATALRALRPKDALRPEFWLVPTTCATGAEAAGVAVYCRDGKKRPSVSPAYVADEVILDGRFLQSLSSEQLANCLCDALSHAVESYVSVVPCALAEEAALSALRRIVKTFHPEDATHDYQALMEASYLAGLAASHCSVGVVHAFAHSAAAYDVRHSHANALGLVPGIRINASAKPLRRLVENCNLRTSEDLVGEIEPIIEVAVRHGEHSALMDALRSPSSRQDFVTSMLQDECLRTNVTSLSNHDIDRYLDQVLQVDICR